MNEKGDGSMLRKPKAWSLSLAIIMMLSIVLSACGGSKESNGTTADGQLAPVELVFYNYATPMKGQDRVMEKVNEYLKKKINATIKVVTMEGSDFETKVPVMLASGQPMDIVFTSSWTNNYLSNVSKQAFTPLTSLLDQYGQDLKKTVPDTLWKGMTVNKELYAVPIYKEIGHQVGVLFRKDLVDKYKLNVAGIQSWKDMEPILKTLHEKDPSILALDGTEGMYRSFPVQHMSGDWNLPGIINVGDKPYYARSDDKIFNQYDTPEFKEFVETAYKWNQAGYTPKDVDYQSENDWKAGKVFAGSLLYAPNYVYKRSAQLGYELDYQNLGKGVVETSDVQGGAYAIPRSSKNPERAMMFLNLLYTDPTLANLFVHGIEGQDYTKVDDQFIKPAEGVDAANPDYDYGYGWMWGNVNIFYYDQSYPKDTLEQFKKFEDNNTPAPALGFNFDTTPVQTEIAAINNVISEYYKPLVTGTVNPDEYLPKFIQKLKDAGVDNMLAEMQTQYDTWKSQQTGS